MAPPRTCECGECPKCKRRVYMHDWYVRHAEQHRATARASQARNREKVRERDRLRPRRYAAPEVEHARNVLSWAVQSGKMTRGECERKGDECSGRIEGHHDDYSKPLDVRWLCQRHHGIEHRKYA